MNINRFFNPDISINIIVAFIASYLAKLLLIALAIADMKENNLIMGRCVHSHQVWFDQYKGIHIINVKFSFGSLRSWETWVQTNRYDGKDVQMQLIRLLRNHPVSRKRLFLRRLERRTNRRWDCTHLRAGQSVMWWRMMIGQHNHVISCEMLVSCVNRWPKHYTWGSSWNWKHNLLIIVSLSSN